MFNVTETVNDSTGAIDSSAGNLITVSSTSCSGSGTYCTVNLFVNPTAASDQWQICAGLSGNDGCTENGVPSVSFEEPYGSTLNYVCTAPNFGGSEYAFSSYSGSYSSTSGCSSSAGISVTSNINITANYVCSGAGSYCTVTLDVSPTAASDQWEVCAGLSGNDGCTGNGVSSDTFLEPYGSTLNYVCTAANFGNSGYYFSSYSGGYSTTAGCSSSAGVVINKNTVIDANYVPCYTLSINAPTAQITNLATGACGGYSYPSGTQVSFGLTPNSGYANPSEYPCSPDYVMSGTYDLCATATGTGNGGYLITMVQNTTENVNMLPCYTLSINAPTSQITNLATGLCGGYSYPSGTEVTFDLTPDSGYTNYPEYPCSPNYVMSGTYDLCATATGTGTGAYAIGMTQATSENVNMNT